MKGDFNMEDIIGIKIDNAATAKCIQIIRRYSDVSIADIKQKITDHEFVYYCDYIDDDEKLPLVIDCYNALKKEKIKVKLYETREGKEYPVQLKFLKNLCQTYQDIDSESEESED